ncbi:MAG: hypothetical protein ETSY2_33280 [Candidatus Entotheonella gemina]|uniref:Uncharacterized protein n=1 Tax=Candidatus Entotheonella gemina TaxID=1429439 RepID=W4LZZ9_9BACT|nr:MAG: hypothetical protein ETSY2_33280 [Candidatus Entotheonella gemina]
MQRIGYCTLRRISTVILLWGVLILWTHPALSEPYLAVRGGYKCSQCHNNITGGGKRNGFGLIYTQTTLPHKIISASTLQRILSPAGASSADPNYGTFITNTFADFLSFGGDLRVENRTRFSEGPLETTNSLDVTEANLYIEALILRDFLSFYIDERLGPNAASSREVFGLIRTPRWWNFYVKGGKFLLPYGWRLQDDSAFIRDRTGINYATPDTGVEFGLEPGPLTFSMALTNGAGGGSDNNLFKQITLRAETVFRHWRAGWSFAYNDTDAARRVMYGPFAGFTLGRLTLLGEVDVIEDRMAESGETIKQLAVFSSLNVLLTRGVNFKLSYELLDPNRSDNSKNDKRTRLTIGLEPFLTQFLQVRLFYRLNDGIPQRPIERADEVVVEFHLFF